MPLEQWLKNGWLKARRSARSEIADLLSIVERDVADAQACGLSLDWKFGIAYNAVLNHYRTLQSMGEIFPERKTDIHYLDACRAKRNAAEYDCAGVVTSADADELIDYPESGNKTVN